MQRFLLAILFTLTTTLMAWADNTVDRPTIHASGVSSDYARTVEVTVATEGADLFYSTDGSNFTSYDAPISLTETATIYAYATHQGVNSEVVSAIVRVNDSADNALSDRIPADAVIYNIAGQRVSVATRPGIYIINGKKRILK